MRAIKSPLRTRPRRAADQKRLTVRGSAKSWGREPHTTPQNRS